MSKLTENDQARINRISELLVELKPLVENAEKLLAQNTIAQSNRKGGNRVKAKLPKHIVNYHKALGIDLGSWIACEVCGTTSVDC